MRGGGGGGIGGGGFWVLRVLGDGLGWGVRGEEGGDRRWGGSRGVVFAW